jgi:hypothetical protein
MSLEEGSYNASRYHFRTLSLPLGAKRGAICLSKEMAKVRAAVPRLVPKAGCSRERYDNMPRSALMRPSQMTISIVE